MKHLALLIAVLFAMLPHHALAWRTLPTGNDYSATPSPTAVNGEGQIATDVGKTLMFTGASLALTGVTIFVQGALTYEPPTHDGFYIDIPMYPIFGVLGVATGAAIALVGLPVYCAGSYKMSRLGGKHYHFARDSQCGFAVTTELGVGLPDCFAFDAVAGYDFSRDLFLGGGVGYRHHLTLVEALGRNQTAALPVYVNARLSLGSKRVSPYVSASAGYDLSSREPYTSIAFGSRLRPTRPYRDASWWVGMKSEFIGDELSFISLQLGKTF